MRAREFIHVTEGSAEYDEPKNPSLELLKLKNQCNEILKTIETVADTEEREVISKIRIAIDQSPERGASAVRSNMIVIVGFPMFEDAPEEVLTWAIAHEIAHIVKSHTYIDIDKKSKTPADIKKMELEADDWAHEIAKRLGVTKAAVWTWLHRKRGGIEKRLQWDASPAGQEWNRNSTHPSITDRIRNAQQHGIELSKNDLENMLDQLDQLELTLA